MNILEIDEIIDLGNNSVLLLWINEIENEKLLAITQMDKTEHGISKKSEIIIPFNTACKYYVEEILRFIEKYQTTTPRQNYHRWLRQNARENPLESPALKDLCSAKTNQIIIQERLPLEALNIINPERLEEQVPGYEFLLSDIIHAITTNQIFSQRIEIPDEQMKIIFYYAFMDRQLITIQIQKEILRTNVYYNYMQTGRMLRELVDLGLVELEECVASKSKYRYFLWKFTGKRK